MGGAALVEFAHADNGLRSRLLRPTMWPRFTYGFWVSRTTECAAPVRGGKRAGGLTGKFKRQSSRLLCSVGPTPSK